MALAFAAQMVGGFGEFGSDFLIAFHLAVEDAQRVLLIPLIAVVAKVRQVVSNRVSEHLPVFWTAFRTSQAVELQFESNKA